MFAEDGESSRVAEDSQLPEDVSASNSSIRTVDVSPLAQVDGVVAAAAVLGGIVALALVEPPVSWWRAPAELQGFAAYALNTFWNGIVLLALSAGLLLRMRIAGVAMIAHLAGISLYRPEIWRGNWIAAVAKLLIASVLIWGALIATRWHALKRRYAIAGGEQPSVASYLRTTTKRLKVRRLELVVIVTALAVALGLEYLSNTSLWKGLEATVAQALPALGRLSPLPHYLGLLLTYFVVMRAQQSPTAAALQRMILALAGVYCIWLALSHFSGLGLPGALSAGANQFAFLALGGALWLYEQGLRWISTPARDLRIRPAMDAIGSGESRRETRARWRGCREVPSFGRGSFRKRGRPVPFAKTLRHGMA